MTARLRTKTGCLRCRSRKKKCDEVQPRCNACAKYNWTCRWSQQTSQVDKHDSPSSSTTQIAYRQRDHEPRFKSFPLSPPFILHSRFANLTEHELVQQWPSCISDISFPNVQLDSIDLFPYLALAVQEDIVRPALAMFSAYVLYLKGDTRFATSLILENYQIAIQKLLLAMSSGCPAPSRIALLVSTTMLGIVESSGIGNPHITAAHLTVAIQTCAQFLRQRACDATGVQVCRLAAELWLYNLPSSCIFLTDAELTRVLVHLDWSMVDALGLCNLKSSISPHRLSHFLGVPPQILLLVLYSVSLAQRRRVVYNLQSQLSQLADKLRQIHGDLESYYRGDVNGDAYAQRSHDTGIVFINALWIYLNSIDRSLNLDQVLSTRQRLDQIFILLDRKRDVIIETSLLWWPLAVVLCAITDDTTLGMFLDRSLGFHFDGGCQRRWNLLVEGVIKQKSQSRTALHGQTLTSERDNLDLLMSEDNLQVFGNGSRHFNSLASTSPGPKKFWIWRQKEKVPTAQDPPSVKSDENTITSKHDRRVSQAQNERTLII